MYEDMLLRLTVVITSQYIYKYPICHTPKFSNIVNVNYA